MGQPVLVPQDIPINLPGETAINVPIEAAGQQWKFTGVSMGNPHAVVFLPPDTDLKTFDLAAIGPQFENNPLFPNRINTEFVHVIDRHTAQMRVWERGSGETMACGTGACAVTVACVLNGLTEPQITVQLVGGDLEIEWNRENNHIYMTGPAAISFTADVETCSVSD
jgi:diaminopimelate epimerase